MRETPDIQQQADAFRQSYQSVRDEVGKVIVGHGDIVDGVLTALFVGGHVLLEGVPGLGKTLLVRTLAQATSLDFNRIQFTPDLMPADITGTSIVVETAEGRRFEFQRGPVFTQMLLADEVNRATPKTQSALLEAMQERSVTVSGATHAMDRPFFVLATQNPIEQEGTYPLPEAQLDRFLFKLVVGYSDREQLHEIINRTTGEHEASVEAVIDGEAILKHQHLVRQVVVAPHVQDYAIRCTLATHPQGEHATAMVNRFIRVGASPRAAQALILGGKVRALLAGRGNVSVEDIRSVLTPAMRHRLLLNFEGAAEGMTTDRVLDDIIDRTEANAAAQA